MIIYQIRFEATQQSYIGVTRDFNKRKLQHLSSLRRNKHVNSRLQNAFNLHGEDNLIFRIVEEFRKKELSGDKEKYWMDLIPKEKRLNVSDVVHSSNRKGEIMFRPSKEQEQSIKALVGKMALVDNKADAIKFLLDLGIYTYKTELKKNGRAGN
jgi:group I intron endonuclease